MVCKSHAGQLNELKPIFMLVSPFQSRETPIGRKPSSLPKGVNVWAP